jgi:hypothetical protein
MRGFLSINCPTGARQGAQALVYHEGDCGSVNCWKATMNELSAWKTSGTKHKSATTQPLWAACYIKISCLPIMTALSCRSREHWPFVAHLRRTHLHVREHVIGLENA